MLKQALDGPADMVLTDMAAPTTGHRATDHIRTIALVEIALEVAEDTLRPGGTFVGKVFQGGSSNELLARLKKASARSSMSSRRPAAPESVELYVVAIGLKTEINCSKPGINRSAREVLPVMDDRRAVSRRKPCRTWMRPTIWPDGCRVRLPTRTTSCRMRCCAPFAVSTAFAAAMPGPGC